MDLVLLSVDIQVIQTYISDWSFVLGNLDYLLGGALLTIGLTIASVVIGFLLGFPSGAMEAYGGPLGYPINWLGVLIRGTPLLVILMLIFFASPIDNAFLASILGLSLRSGAYQSQIFRGALQSVENGEIMAGRSLGMTWRETILMIAAPQAIRRSLPSMQNEITIVLKDTSFAFVLGVVELMTRGHELFVQKPTSVTEVFIAISAIYFVITFCTNRGLNMVEDRYNPKR